MFAGITLDSFLRSVSPESSSESVLSLSADCPVLSSATKAPDPASPTRSGPNFPASTDAAPSSSVTDSSGISHAHTDSPTSALCSVEPPAGLVERSDTTGSMHSMHSLYDTASVLSANDTYLKSIESPFALVNAREEMHVTELPPDYSTLDTVHADLTSITFLPSSEVTTDSHALHAGSCADTDGPTMHPTEGVPCNSTRTQAGAIFGYCCRKNWWEL